MHVRRFRTGYYRWPVILILFFPRIELYGQHQVRFEPLTIDAGLSQSSINCIVQDSRGFMWFGTEDGLNRFDGNTFVTFKKRRPDSLTVMDNWINAFGTDDDGNVWIATEEGYLSRYRPEHETFRHYFYGKIFGTTSVTIRAMEVDAAGRIWMGSENDGVIIFDPRDASVRRLQKADGIQDDRIRSLWIDSRRQTIWAASAAGIDECDAATLQVKPVLTVADGLSSAYPSPGKIWWIGHGRSLSRLINGRLETVLSGLPAAVDCIVEDDRRTMWLGTSKGLVQWEPSSRRMTLHRPHHGKDGTLSDGKILSLYVDQSSVLWIGTQTAGLNKVDPSRSRFEHYYHNPDEPSSLSSNNVRAVFQDRQGIVWIGTSDGGLDRWDRLADTFVNYNRFSPSTPLNHETVRAILEDRNGHLWIGTHDGLNRLDRFRRRISLYQHRPTNDATLSSNQIRCLLEDEDGKIWIGTDGGGLNRLDPMTGRVERFVHRPDDPTSLSNDRIMALFKDRDGKSLWVGTNGGGLNRWDPIRQTAVRFRHDTYDRNSISHDRIRSIYQDDHRVLWIGTNGGGLNRMHPDTGSFLRMSESSGFPSDVVYGILPDASGRLWLSTNRGLCRFDPTTSETRVYDVNDGLQSNEFNSLAYFRNPRGEMFFGGINGLSVFHPDSLQNDAFIPPVVITQFRKFDEIQPLGNLRQAGRIELAYDETFISFEFAALSYANPGKHQYAYRLEGFDKDWVQCGTRRYAAYTNLDPGRYVFHVKGSNHDGVWNEKGESITVVVLPPFWETWWFQSVVVVVIVGVLWMSIRQRTRRLRNHRQMLENAVRSRTHELHRKTVQLERMHQIIQRINGEIDLRELYDVIVQELNILPRVESSAVLMWDAAVHAYRFLALYGVNEKALESIHLSLAEAEARYTDGVAQPFPDIFVVRDVEGRRGEEKIRPLGIPKSMLVARLAAQGRVYGYLVFDNYRDRDAFRDEDAALLYELKDHIHSALIKAQLVEELRVLNDKKNEFLGIAAHDLRNPLSTIRSYLDFINADIKSGNFDTQAISNDLENMTRYCDHMTMLIAELLDISAIESGKVTLDMEVVHIDHVVREREPFHQRAALKKNIRMHFDAPPSLAPVRADRSRIEEVVDNLISNAIKYTHHGGTVQVVCESTDGKTITHVKDTGQGLSEEDLKYVFHSFRKLSARPTAGEPSTGLGLAIVKKIVEMHGGRVWVESEKGKGSTFSFALPVVDTASSTKS